MRNTSRVLDNGTQRCIAKEFHLELTFLVLRIKISDHENLIPPLAVEKIPPVVRIARDGEHLNQACRVHDVHCNEIARTDRSCVANREGAVFERTKQRSPNTEACVIKSFSRETAEPSHLTNWYLMPFRIVSACAGHSRRIRSSAPSGVISCELAASSRSAMFLTNVDPRTDRAILRSPGIQNSLAKLSSKLGTENTMGGHHVRGIPE